MRLQVVSVYDRKLEQYHGLFVVRRLEEAARSWGDSIPKDEVVMAHPEDFRMDKLADFDPETGELFPCAPSLVLEAQLVVRRRLVDRAQVVGDVSVAVNNQLDLEDEIRRQQGL